MASDGELLEACRAGKTAAFGELVDRYQSLVAAVTFAATGDRVLSEDLAQDTFIAAWRQLGELREPGSFRAWLCGIARNLGAKARRRFGREVGIDAAEPVDAGPAVDDALADEQSEAIVWRSLESLPLTYREPLILYYREGCSAQQVADALGVSVAAVEQRLSRGRKQLEAGVEKLVERSLRRSRPNRSFAAAVVGAIQSGSSAPATVVPVASKGAMTMKTMLIAGAAATAVVSGYAVCTPHEADEDTATARVRSEPVADPERAAGVAAEVVERVEARDRARAAEASADVPEQPFELTRISDTLAGVNLAGGPSALTSPFAIDRELGPPRTISGRVVDADGTPVRGAIVLGGKFLTMRLGTTVTSDAGAVTDAAGRWSLTLRQAEPGSVAAWHRNGVSEVATLPAGTDDREIELRLSAPASFTGTVRQRDAGVAATVTLQREEPRQAFTATADDSGRARLDYVPPGAYKAVATTPYQDTQSIDGRVSADVVIEAGEDVHHDFVLPTGALVVTEVAWPEEHEVTTVSYYLLLGRQAPATAAELAALAKAERSARFLLVGGDNLHDAMSFSDVLPGEVTACAVAKRDRDSVIGFDCTQIEVTDETDTVTVELDPFAG